MFNALYLIVKALIDFIIFLKGNPKILLQYFLNDDETRQESRDENMLKMSI